MWIVYSTLVFVGDSNPVGSAFMWPDDMKAQDGFTGVCVQHAVLLLDRIVSTLVAVGSCGSGV